MSRDKWIEIDVDAVEQNLQAVKGLLADKARLIAVVKANAYGHGAEDMARILCQNGVDYLAVSFYHEALQLRKAGIEADILVFAPVISEAEALESIQNQLTLTITSDIDRELLERAAVSANHHQVRIHLKIDTGLGRFGMNEDEAGLVCQNINKNDRLCLEGIYSHIADPSSPAYTQEQFRRFMRVVNRLENEKITIPIKHFANSSVCLSFPEMYLNAVRIGTLLSGQHPVGHFSTHLQLRDPYKFMSRIISLRTLAEGSYLGYYRTYKLRRAAQIGVIPVGFNDGLALEVANRPLGVVDMLKKLAKIVLAYLGMARYNLYVTIKDKKYPIRGKVFMQMALVEIPNGIEINIGDEVELPVRKTLAACDIDRIYVRAGQAGEIAGN